MPNFNEAPGLLFVVATVLPLASFLIMFLLCGVWALARRYEWEGIQEALGNESASKGAAWLATLAIGVAFLCSLAGGLIMLGDWQTHQDVLQFAHDNAKKARKKFADSQGGKQGKGSVSEQVENQ